MDNYLVQRQLADAIKARGYEVTFDHPGEGFYLDDPQGNPVEQGQAADPVVNDLAMVLEDMTTNEEIDCEGEPRDVALACVGFLIWLKPGTPEFTEAFDRFLAIFSAPVPAQGGQP